MPRRRTSRAAGWPLASAVASTTGAVSTWWACARSTAFRNSVIGSALAMRRLYAFGLRRPGCHVGRWRNFYARGAVWRDPSLARGIAHQTIRGVEAQQGIAIEEFRTAMDQR